MMTQSMISMVSYCHLLYCTSRIIIATLVNEREFVLSDQVRQWLGEKECLPEYAEMFEKHGYFKLSFVAGMTAEVLH